jgi:hypothetical protein
MSDPDRTPTQDTGATPPTHEVEEEPRNPFDNPYFLPVLLGAFALWCGWDGFVSDKFADRPNTLWFNRIMFVLLGAAAAWLLAKARREGSGS